MNTIDKRITLNPTETDRNMGNLSAMTDYKFKVGSIICFVSAYRSLDGTYNDSIKSPFRIVAIDDPDHITIKRCLPTPRGLDKEVMDIEGSSWGAGWFKPFLFSAFQITMEEDAI
jgi:hypothetical protein